MANILPRFSLRPADPIPVSEETWQSLGRSLSLSDRELQVVQSLFRNDAETGIAADLGISPHTVHSHIDRIHKKLGVTSRVALVVEVFRAYLHLEQPSPHGRLHYPTSLAVGLLLFGNQLIDLV